MNEKLLHTTIRSIKRWNLKMQTDPNFGETKTIKQTLQKITSFALKVTFYPHILKLLTLRYNF